MARRRVSNRHAPPAFAAPLLALTTLLAACGDGADRALPDREPDVTGVVAGTGTHAVLTEPSDDYFDGMSLVASQTSFVGADGEPIESAGLTTGDEVEVWTTGSCAESYPVRCEPVAVRVVG